MPRVNTQTRSTRGRAKRCGNCGREIQPGEKYFSFSFRYGGTQVRCKDHYPKQSELTQSKMSEVYSAVESAEDDMASAETVQDITDAVEGVAGTVREVAEEYEAAAEPFGGQGENQERADELSGWADELESFQPEEVEEEEDCDECEGTGEVHEDCNICEGSGEFNDSTCEACEGSGQVSSKCEQCEGDGKLDNSEALTEAIETAREEATELLNGCPL